MTDRPPGTAPADQAARDVDLLFDARSQGCVGLDLRSRDYTHAEALDLQLAVLDRFLRAGDKVAGWKATFASGSGRDRMGTGFRPFGYILASRAVRSGEQVEFSRFANLAIEPELCLRLGADLTGSPSIDQARAAVDAVEASFELNEARYVSDADDATILADGCTQWGLVVGAGAASRDRLTRTTVELWHDDELVSTSTPGDAMDDPFLSLARVAALLHEHGRSLAAGERVITGSFARAAVTGPGRWRAVFHDIGVVTVRIV